MGGVAVMAKSGPKAAVSTLPLDLSELPAGGGERVVAFVERFCTVTKGVGARRPVWLRPFQREVVHGLFDEPRPRSALLSLPRGNGKSSMAAYLCAYGLYGDGVEGAEVLCVASDERQANIVMGMVRRIIELSPELEARTHMYVDRVEVPSTGSVMRALPSEMAALQGWSPSLCILDELHVVGPDIWESLDLAAGKRDRSLLLAISTPAAHEDSVMWRLVEQGRASTSYGFYFREWAAPEGCNLDDEAAWHQANPALGDFLAIDALRSTRQTVRESAFRRFRLGQWAQDDAAWLPAGAWAACTDLDRQLRDGEPVVLGFDGSDRLDATALVAVTIEDRPHVEVLGLWESSGEPSYQVPITDVENRIRDACARFSVRQVVCDPFRWRRSMQILAADGLPVVDFPQSPARMVPATARFYQAVVEGQVSHTGDPDLARHVASCHARTDHRGTTIRKESKHSTRRIDLAVAAVMALDAAASLPPPAPQVRVISLADID